MDGKLDRVEAWLAVALQGLSAGRLLRANGALPRSAASRLYFAGYAAVHATLIHLGSEPPVRGNWPHSDLAEHLRATLAARTQMTRSKANSFKIDLANLYNLRVRADYGAMGEPDRPAVDDAFRACSRLVGQAEGMIRS